MCGDAIGIQHIITNSYDARVQYVRSLLSPLVHKHSIVLDAGCGLKNYFLNKASVKKLVGIDVRQDVIEKNTDISEGIVGDVQHLESCGEDKFDLVMSNDVLEHLEDPVEFVKSASKVLKSDGHLFLVTPNKISLLGLLTASLSTRYLKVFSRLLLGRATDNETHFYRLNTVNRIRKTLLHNGFCSIRIILLHQLPTSRLLRIVSLPDYIVGRTRLIPYYSGRLICVAQRQ